MLCVFIEERPWELLLIVTGHGFRRIAGINAPFRKIFNNYYMANPVLGKSPCSDWFFLGQGFAVRTVSLENFVSGLHDCLEFSQPLSCFNVSGYAMLLLKSKRVGHEVPGVMLRPCFSVLYFMGWCFYKDCIACLRLQFLPWTDLS